MHDRQATIPMAEMTSARVDNLYDLMDRAYDTVETRTHSASLGHVPIIDLNPRRSTEQLAQASPELHVLCYLRLTPADGEEPTVQPDPNLRIVGLYPKWHFTLEFSSIYCTYRRALRIMLKQR